MLQEGADTLGTCSGPTLDQTSPGPESPLGHLPHPALTTPSPKQDRSEALGAQRPGFTAWLYRSLAVALRLFAHL